MLLSDGYRANVFLICFFCAIRGQEKGLRFHFSMLAIFHSAFSFQALIQICSRTGKYFKLRISYSSSCAHLKTFSFLLNALIKILKNRERRQNQTLTWIPGNHSLACVWSYIYELLKLKLADHENPQELTSFNDNEIHTADCQVCYFV